VSYKQQIIAELCDLEESLTIEVLDFLRFLKIKQIEDREDLADAQHILATTEGEERISWEVLKAEIGL
jgi:hypothetical protein